jgi:hypothetical protein
MVLMDKIYLLVYVIISLVMFKVIVAGNILSKSAKDERRIARVDRRETWFAVVYFVAFAIGVIWLAY